MSRAVSHVVLLHGASWPNAEYLLRSGLWPNDQRLSLTDSPTVAHAYAGRRAFDEENFMAAVRGVTPRRFMRGAVLAIRVPTTRLRTDALAYEILNTARAEIDLPPVRPPPARDWRTSLAQMGAVVLDPPGVRRGGGPVATTPFIAPTDVRLVGRVRARAAMHEVREDRRFVRSLTPGEAIGSLRYDRWLRAMRDCSLRSQTGGWRLEAGGPRARSAPRAERALEGAECNERPREAGRRARRKSSLLISGLAEGCRLMAVGGARSAP